MPSATVTSKGQITIPIEVRKALGLDAGVEVDFYEIEEGRFGLTPRTASIRDLKGCIPKLDHVPTIEEMNQDVLDAVAENYRESLNRSADRDSEVEAA
jgi:AbrB family looped-hinge helix DNA binding protein